MNIPELFCASVYVKREKKKHITTKCSFVAEIMSRKKPKKTKRERKYLRSTKLNYNKGLNSKNAFGNMSWPC
jgi:hypothetical protein